MTTDAGTPTHWPIEDVVARDFSGWARSLYNCTTGDNYLRTSEYHQLIRDLDAYEIVLAAAREQIAALTAERDALRARVAGLEAGLLTSLESVRNTLEAAYHNCYESCCGRAGYECCGNTVQTWAPEDQRTMDVLGQVERTLRALLAPSSEPQP